MERPAFPSDRYAAGVAGAFPRLDPARDLIDIESRPGEQCLRTEDILAPSSADGPRIRHDPAAAAFNT